MGVGCSTAGFPAHKKISTRCSRTKATLKRRIVPSFGRGAERNVCLYGQVGARSVSSDANFGNRAPCGCMECPASARTRSHTYGKGKYRRRHVEVCDQWRPAQNSAREKYARATHPTSYLRGCSPQQNFDGTNRFESGLTLWVELSPNGQQPSHAYWPVRKSCVPRLSDIPRKRENRQQEDSAPGRNQTQPQRRMLRPGIHLARRSRRAGHHRRTMGPHHATPASRNYPATWHLLLNRHSLNRLATKIGNHN